MPPPDCFTGPVARCVPDAHKCLNFKGLFDHSTPMRSFVFAISMLAAAALAAQTPEEERDSLRGLDGVMVLVERLHADAEKIQLTRDDLEREVVYRFNRAEIPALTSEERAEDERQPYLYVNCNIIYVPEIELTSFSIDVELHQIATLKDGQEMPVLTWARSYLGIQHRDRAAAAIRSRLGEFIEQFVADYKSVNRTPTNRSTNP